METAGPRVVGERIEALLDELRSSRDPRAAAVAEELVRSIVDLYGAALARVMELASADPSSPALVDKLVADPLVESLLLVHDLHPLDVDTRIQRALDGVRPYLGSHAGGVQYQGVDDAGIVHLTLEGSCNGCPSSTLTVKLAIERAITDAAPETVGVDVVGMVDESVPPLLQIQPRPPDQQVAPAPAPAAEPGWVRLPSLAVQAPTTVMVDGLAVLICRLDGSLYAYRDGCPACGHELADGRLDGDSLRCPGCGSRYDVRLAGMGLDDPSHHLVPLPLLADDAGVRIAIGAGIAS